MKATVNVTVLTPEILVFTVSLIIWIKAVPSLNPGRAFVQRICPKAYQRSGGNQRTNTILLMPDIFRKLRVRRIS